MKLKRPFQKDKEWIRARLNLHDHVNPLKAMQTARCIKTSLIIISRFQAKDKEQRTHQLTKWECLAGHRQHSNANRYA